MRRLAIVVVWCVALAACGAGSGSPASQVTSTSSTPSSSAPSTSMAPATTMSDTLAPTTSTTTSVVTGSTAARDLEIAVSTPKPGSRVADRLCVFEGVVDPSVELVAAGRYPVDVAADGAWQTTLLLNPGGNVARFTAADTEGGTTEVLVPVFYDPPLELRADGLGPHDLFVPMEGMMVDLVELLGTPDRDEITTADDAPDDYGGWFAVFALTGYPGHTYARFVGWDTAGLTVMFSDYDAMDTGEPGPVVFNGWHAKPSGEFGARLATGTGIGPGSLLSEVELAYAGAVTTDVMPDDLDGQWHYVITTNAPSFTSEDTMNYYGILDGEPTTPGVRIDTIQAGFGFDSC
jgi:hypothetical protein